MNFFKNIETLEELRKEYKKLAIKHHPDRGGKTEDMQAINAEYEELLKIVGNIRKSANGETYTKSEYDYTKDNFREIISKIINLDITIELCGSWLWVFGGFSVKEELKKAGFFWCSNKKAWAWTDEPTSQNKHKLTMDEIRKTYGSEIVKQQSEKNLIEGVA
jgi:preprotein translocase subunit Sec63